MYAGKLISSALFEMKFFGFLSVVGWSVGWLVSHSLLHYYFRRNIYNLVRSGGAGVFHYDRV